MDQRFILYEKSRRLDVMMRRDSAYDIIRIIVHHALISHQSYV